MAAAYDAVIVGAGMFGATLARELTDRGRKVLVVEKRDHVGGMCRTQDWDGIPFHRYGPHVFHTNERRIWDFVNRFAEFEAFMVRTKAVARGKLWSFPINLMTFYQLWGTRTPAEAEEHLRKVRIPRPTTDTIEDWALATYGREIFETFIQGYTRKQWGREPDALPAGILQRLPVRTTFDDNYFTDRFQGIPKGGYAPMFDRMLEGVDVELCCDFMADRTRLDRMGVRVVFSGRIDEYFGFKLGPLAFRSCRFVHKPFDGDFQGNPVINYCDPDVAWTRIVEHKHFSNARAPRTLVTWEYPYECGADDDPLYPVADDANQKLYRAYAEIQTSTVFAGRLGSYRYFDMCEVIAQAWKVADQLTS